MGSSEAATSYAPDVAYQEENLSRTETPENDQEVDQNGEVRRSLKEQSRDDIADYAFLPIKRPALIKFYYNQRDMRWVPADVDMRQDRQDWDTKCDDGMKRFVKGILAFFVPADGIVTANIFSNFQQDTSMYKEAAAFYAEQAAMEMVHSEMYSLTAEALIRDRKELHMLYNSIDHFPAVRRIADFMFKYMDKAQPLPVRVIAFACVEGVLFNSAFASIYWIKKKNILRGFCKANEFIARDEAIHTCFACVLFTLICARDDQETPDVEHVHEIIDEAVDTNAEFIRDILPVEMIGMSSEDLLEYTKCTADALLVSLGYKKLYNSENPFDWMAVISLPNRTNFFEDKVSEYAKQSQGDFVFDLDDEF